MGRVITIAEKENHENGCVTVSGTYTKCIVVSSHKPTCIEVYSNIITEDNPRRDDVAPEQTIAPELEIILVNNETPILNVNLDEDGTVYVTDFDVVYIKITNYDADTTYVNIFSNQDGYGAEVYLDDENEQIIWALDDYALEGIQMWFYAQALDEGKPVSPQSSVTVMQMEQSEQPHLSVVASANERSTVEVTIGNYNPNATYSDPIVSGGTAERVDAIIYWTLPSISEDESHTIEITCTEPLKYESDVGVKDITVVPLESATILWLELREHNVPHLGLWIYDGVNYVEVEGFTWGTSIVTPSTPQVTEGGLTPTNTYKDLAECKVKWAYYLNMHIRSPLTAEIYYTHDTVDTIISSTAFRDAVRLLSGIETWGA